jgi:hypothetical protein
MATKKPGTFVKFDCHQKYPKNMGKSEIEAFLSHIATHRKVAASTQRQVLNALDFLQACIRFVYRGRHRPSEGQETPPSSCGEDEA